MKKVIAIVLVSLFGFAMQAQEKKNKNAKADVEVKGNCEMCKKRIEKAAYSVAGVKSAVWHSDDQMLHLVYNEQKCSTTDVEKAVAKAGHDTKDVKATEAEYNTLHDCCQYDR
ncbi:heavy-metal-associated domain-containing protein [Flavobacterium suncheonense]|uniref:Metal transporter n=1 Tax=Flavobacterium suncheonense GH29-5 = DSM 17707 TaxID=1121899 RepID=A0A0A2MBR9_9FLAO|nr:metal transporter [Flavobacterium suncheonense]KGO88913.1 metal transporter [Flavobacterium suncheonense GH29-5 = DSM 17707]